MSAVIITRPAHQAAILARWLENRGDQPIIFPTLDILPVEDNRLLRAAVQRIAAYDFVLFVSANAVSHALPFYQPGIAIKAMAIGPGTARALAAYGVTPVWIPAAYHSEGLLSSPLLQEISGKNIAIFCGENSRGLLKSTLTQRGARVDEIICYRRRCPIVDAAAVWQAWQRANVRLIISTSRESLANLWQLFDKVAHDGLLRIPLLVISPAMAEQAAQLGFQVILTAAGANDEAIRVCLQFY
jgi:uroporphyrinogen-III synthase